MTFAAVLTARVRRAHAMVSVFVTARPPSASHARVVFLVVVEGHAPSARSPQVLKGGRPARNQLFDAGDHPAPTPPQGLEHARLSHLDHLSRLGRRSFSTAPASACTTLA